ncbi:MAG TPA: hypothetical protein DCY20_02150, partial [Firmicutes bacterium]|nr:hypothetical protein [Bacillota bacterium]
QNTNQNESNNNLDNSESSQPNKESSTGTNQGGTENNGNKPNVENLNSTPDINQTTTSNPTSNEDVALDFEKIKDSFSTVDGITGTGTEHDPFQLSYDLLLTQANLLRYLKIAWGQEGLKLEQVTEEIGFTRYKMRFMSQGLGSANEFYIELIIPTDNQNVTTEQNSNSDVIEMDLNEETLSVFENTKEMAYSSVISL